MSEASTDSAVLDGQASREVGSQYTDPFAPLAGSSTAWPAQYSRPYSRVLLKLSGEALMGKAHYGIDPGVVNALALEVRYIVAQGVQTSIVVGGGNIWRGLEASSKGMDRSTADYMGMLATVLNALALQDALEKVGVQTRVQSALTIQEVAEPYIRRRALRHMEKGRVVVLAGGTGNPYFTTDSAAALRALELGAQAILMAKNDVDGVYEADPKLHPEARRFVTLDYRQALELNLRIMDSTALALCMDNKIPLIVFNFQQAGNIRRAVGGQHVGTFVGPLPTTLAKGADDD